MEIMDRILNIGTPYLTSEAGRKLKDYKYSGKDLSLLYNYVASPLAEKIASVCPMWLGANTITFFSFLILVVTHFHMSYYLWDLEGDIPAFPCIAAGIGYFVYYILDCTDGKQARRTNTASTMGLIFDHGVDSVGAAILCLTVPAITQMGVCVTVPLYLFCLMNGFFLSTLEEYYVLEQTFPIINGVSEGTIFVCAIEICTGLFGIGFWTEPLIFSITPRMVISGILFIGIIPTSYNNLSSIFAKGASVASVLRNSVVHVLILSTMWYHYLTSDLSGGDLRMMMYIYGLLECKLFLHLMVAHVTAEPFESSRISIISFCILIFVHQSLPVDFRLFKDRGLIVIGLIYALIIYFHLALHMIKEMKYFLGINFFIITPQIKSKS